MMVEEIGKQIAEVCNNEEVKVFIEGLDKVKMDVDKELLSKCSESLATHEKQLIEEQTNLYKEWSKSRDSKLDEEYQLLVRKSRKEAITQTKEELASEEEKLFFFEKFDTLEQEKEEKVQAWVKTFPRMNWSSKDYYRKGKYLPKPGQERKEARWEKREAKKGPAK